MNPIKIVEEVLATIQKFSPIIVVHLILFLWLSSRVLDPNQLPKGKGLWELLKSNITTTLQALGLEIQIWIALVIIVIAYFALFQWVRLIVSGLPVLRLVYFTRYDDDLIAEACRVLRLPPRKRLIEVELNNLVDEYNKEIQESNRVHPYQWLFDSRLTWSKYYDTILVVTLGVFAWAINGGIAAYSPGDVWKMFYVLVLVLMVLRFQSKSKWNKSQMYLADWAIREYQRRNKDEIQDPLEWERYGLAKQEAEYFRLSRYGATQIVRNIGTIFPSFVRKRIHIGLYNTYWSIGGDWEINESFFKKAKDEKYIPPSGLSVNEYKDRFQALLECKGAGLCILTPYTTGIAPCLMDGGSSYDFATREHGRKRYSINLFQYEGHSREYLKVYAHGDEGVFLVNLGNVPIEIINTFHLNQDAHKYLHFLKKDFPTADWLQNDLVKENSKLVNGIEISNVVLLVPGSSYIARYKSSLGNETVIAFQCFKPEDNRKTLLAWRILQVYSKAGEMPDIDYWWKLGSWKNVLLAMYKSFQPRLWISDLSNTLKEKFR